MMNAAHRSREENEMTNHFQGAVALVTGAGGGFGLATAKAFASAGAAVTLVDRSQPLLDAAVEDIRKSGQQAVGLVCDVSDAAQVRELFAEAIAVHGRIDAAFNNAGVNSKAANFLETTDDEFERVLGTNLRGMWNCMKVEVAQMLKQGSGAIVNCSSIGGVVGSPGRSAYSASKHAIIGLTKSAAIEYASRNIRINAICPGIFNTPMTVEVTHDYDPTIVEKMLAQAPIGRFGEPEEIAAAVLWLCGPGASYMIGHALVADGGFLCR